MIYVEIIDDETGAVRFREQKQDGKNYAALAADLFAARPQFDRETNVFRFEPRRHTVREVEDGAEELARLRQFAVSLLAKTDFVVIKAAEGREDLSPAWLHWREQLRAVVRGDAYTIPPEPYRYADLFTPPTPVSDQPSTQAQASAPPSAEAAVPSGEAGGGAAYAGTMLQEDRENYLRGQITVRVTQIEQSRLQGRYDINAQERQRWGFTAFHNLSDLGQPIPDDVRAAYEEFLVADQWARATKDHADALRAAAIAVGLDLLEAMQTSVEEGWP